MTIPANENGKPQNIDQLTLAVLGAGLMGHSIAGVFAHAGAHVTLFDTNSEVLSSAPNRIMLQFERRGLGSDAAGRTRLCSDMKEAVSGADLVIEAVPEILELKQVIFARLDEWLPEAILATNSSVLRTSDIAARASRPERILGMHWFNPPHLIPVVEVVQGELTDPTYVARVMELLKQAGKLPVHVRKDIPGFIGNRLQHALWREAMHLIATEVCDAETVDIVTRNSFGMRLAAMGPIENADYVGLDLAIAVHENIFPSLCNDTIPSPILRRLVEEGHLGAKTGSGFGEWPAGRREEATKRLEAHLLKQIQ